MSKTFLLRNKVSVYDIDSAVAYVFENRFEKILEILSTPSINCPPDGNEYASQIRLIDWIKELGVEPSVFTPDEVLGLRENSYYNPDPRNYDGRPDVVARWLGKGNGKSLLLTTHVDVVGTGDESKWKYPPFSATIADGCIHGRGTVDVKAGLCSLLIAIEVVLCQMKMELPGDVIFASVVDEEFGGMNGSLAVVEAGYTADACILVEPSALQVCPAAPGGQQYFLNVEGKNAYEGNSQDGVCAIEKFIKIYQALRKLEEDRNVRGRKIPMFADYIRPFPITVSTINGGNLEVGGIVDHCRSFIWHSAMPGETQDDILAEVRTIFDKLAQSDPWLEEHPPQIELVGAYLDPCQTPQEHPFVKTAVSSVSGILGKKVRPIGLQATCDQSRFVLAGGIPTIVLGPGDPALVHSEHENIPIKELKTFVRIISQIIIDWCGDSDDSNSEP